jgi:hypothetical protein
MPEFRDYLDSQCKAPLPDPLPLVHTSRCEWASSLVLTPELQPRRCLVYDDDLLYLFYGRPAYRIRERGHRHDITYCPICFILKLNRQSLAVRRVMPLDSGGASEGRFSPHIDPHQKDLLELDPSLDSARKLVDVFYKDSRSYLYGHCQPLSAFVGASPAIVEQYVNMLHDADVSRADDRRSAVEIQATKKVLLKDDLQAVVLPEALLDDYGLKRAILEDWNALPITYPTFHATSPSEYAPVIRDRVVAFYETYHFI